MNTSYYITLAQEYEEINFPSLLFTLLLQYVTGVSNTKLVVRYVMIMVPKKRGLKDPFILLQLFKTYAILPSGAGASS